MSASDHEKTKERAYQLWEQAGRPEGDAERFWYQAERETGTDGGEAAADDGASEPQDAASQKSGPEK